MKKAMHRHGSPAAITTDGQRSYRAAMPQLGRELKQEIGRSRPSLTDLRQFNTKCRKPAQSLVSAIIRECRTARDHAAAASQRFVVKVTPLQQSDPGLRIERLATVKDTLVVEHHRLSRG